MIKDTNGKGNVPERDVWETPQELWDKLNSQYGFTFDCCADGYNHKTVGFSNNFLKIDFRVISNICWMNPPFSKAYEMFEHFFKVINNGVCIYKCDNMETKIWQDVILKNADWIFIPKGRISYEGFEGNGSRFPSGLIGVGVPPPVGLDGYTLKVLRANPVKQGSEVKK